jgi:uncharacterized membrane protein YdfJ with MMPL/SSD domain
LYNRPATHHTHNTTPARPPAHDDRLTHSLSQVRATQINEELFKADTTVIQDIEQTDAITLPIAFLSVLLVVGWSGVLALAALLASVSVTMWLALPVAQNFTMPSFAPSMFISFTIALTVDYALFLLSAYRKATHLGLSNYGAVCRMLQTSGQVRGFVRACVRAWVCM